MANSNDSIPPPITSGGYQTTPRELLKKKSFITGDELGDSYLQALYTANGTQYIKLGKFALHRFLEECLRKDGQFRSFFDKFAPYTGGFIVNENFTPDNERKRHLQIARFFTGAKERPPQIFIQDGGYTYTPASLGGLTGGWNQRDKYGNQVAHVFDSVPMPLEVTFASLSEEEVDEMSGFFSMAFGSFQRFLTGWYLKPEKAIKGAYWILMLPLIHTISPKSRQSLHGDPKSQLWVTTLSLDCVFENSTYLTYRAKPVGDLGPGALSVQVPEKVTLNSVVPVYIQNIPYPIKVYSDNYKIAIVEEEATQFIIYPKRIGKFNIVIYKEGDTEDNMGERIILAQKEVTVSLR